MTIFNVQDGSAPQQKHFGDRAFPLVLTPDTDSVASPPTAADAVAWAAANRDVLRSRLLKSGAVLFRDFPIDSPADFSDFVEALGVEPLPYVGGAAPRHAVYKAVHTTNESPPDQPIPFHHEMAQVPVYPKTIFFYAEQPAVEGGETPICPSDIAVERLEAVLPEQTRKIEDLGVRYMRVLPEEDDNTSPIGRSWVSTFQTRDKDEATRKAENLGTTLEWLPTGDVKSISPVLKAIKTYPATGKKVWFNSVVAAYLGWIDSRNDPKKAVTLGSGEYVDPQVIETMSGIMADISVSLPWQKGDVMWIDNEQVLHSRAPFVPPRRILAYLGKN
ncbi:hypothetical protein HK405_015519 [Cladochytrium tenue]|nr:hypothetical protein HK405_015519 [Cladochytrium tenue]